MKILGNVALAIAVGVSWILFLYTSFKIRQTSGKEFLNDAYTDFGEGSFSASIINPIKRFIWGIASVATLILSVGLSFTLLARFDDGLNINNETTNKTPSAEVSKSNIESSSRNPQITESKPAEDTSNQKHVEREELNTSSSSSSILSVCESESNFIYANNCRWRICAEPQNKSSDECKSYTRD